MADPTKQCPIHKDAAQVACPQCIAYKRTQGYAIERGQFAKIAAPPAATTPPVEPVQPAEPQAPPTANAQK